MITVTGATGQLGRLTIDALLERGVAAETIIAVVRNPARATDLADRGIQVRRGDYTDPASLTSALAGTDKLLLISSSEVGHRVEQHRNVIGAAVAAGVQQIIYTSVLRADTSTMLLAAEHQATEALLGESGLNVVLLRNGWYIENYTQNLAPAPLETRRSRRPPGPTMPRPQQRCWPVTGTTKPSTNSAGPLSPRPIWPPRSPGRAADRSPTRICRSRPTPRSSPEPGYRKHSLPSSPTPIWPSSEVS